MFELDHPDQAAEFNAILKTKNLSSINTTPKNEQQMSTLYFLHQTTTIENKLSQETSSLNALKILKAKEKWKEVQLNKLSSKVGLMFASKPIVQLIANPFIGPLTNRYIECIIQLIIF